jgi:hypothetical protein
MRHCLTRLGAALVVGFSGCGPDHGMTLGRVSGTVTYRGEPVRYGTVMFMPDSTKGTEGPPAMTTLQSTGEFSLSTDSANDGALVGFHKVGIVGLDPTPIRGGEETKNDESPKDPMKAKRLSITTVRRKSDGHTFTDPGGRVYKYVIPKEIGNAETSGIQVEVTRGSNRFNFDVQEDGKVKVK